MGDITLEKYVDDSMWCIRIRWTDPATGEVKVATFTQDAWQEGLEPPGSLLWWKENFEAAKRAFEMVCNTATRLAEEDRSRHG